MKIQLYDTTLRDGTQSEGISLSVNDKLKITKRLDDFGINYIEGGWPGSNPKDVEYFERVRDLDLKQAKIAAFGSTRRKNSDVESDPNIKALVDAQTPVVTVVGKSSDLHVRDVLETTPKENLAMIEESVAYLKGLGKEVVYDAEHFFDGYKANPEYALATVQAAARGGADILVLCETNGGSLPWEVEEIVKAVIEKTGTPVGVHTHDDGGNGVANSLAGIRAGAVHVQGTINGYGERVGNANLCTIIPNLQLKMGYECVSEENLKALSKLSHYVAEIANQPQNPYLPFVGKKAFAHKGGIHVAAILKNEDSYQHIDPTLVGNKRRTLVSELSGRGNIIDKAKEFGIEVTSDKARQVVEQIKGLEAQGFTFEGAGASAQLLMERAEEGYKAPFELIDFMVIVESRQGRGVFAEATVKVEVDGKTFHTAAEGNGPVNALNKALRKALEGSYPRLAEIHLSDYKVRILDSESGTEAITRVLIDTKNGDNSRWSTVGASTNIIEASWLALADSMEYALQKE
ncbi:MAG: citramalate synthase [Anaerolineae bacterium]|nr:citramalate synthase [Anaerolineae bacterium]MBT7070814.1 citramalate synthase [Anaerolineae bacterium]MBT7323696.1 citramalate synthase [Anaerolineae bacterium]